MADGEREWFDSGAGAGLPEMAPDDSFPAGSISDQIASQLASNMYESTKTQARGMLDMYGNIDVIRPYFDVEPQHVLQRLVGSLLPRRSSPLVAEALIGEDGAQPRGRASAAHLPDLYGPLMLAFTLASVLLMALQLTGTHLSDGTLVGSSLFLCFSYWLLSSTLYSIIAFTLNASLRWLQILSVTGYSLFGPCLAVLVQCIGLGSTLQWSIVLALGALSALSMALLFMFKTADRTHGMGFAATVFAIHFVFTVWLCLYYAHVPAASTLLGEWETAAEADGAEAADGGGDAQPPTEEAPVAPILRAPAAPGDSGAPFEQ